MISSVARLSCRLLSQPKLQPSIWAVACLRTYISRAHPRPIPEFAIDKALDDLLKDVEMRKKSRQKKWEKNAPERARKGIVQDACSHPDETVEMALNLNLDPRKPGQALRGSVSLPHGTGKAINCVVFTNDEELQEKAIKAGALHAGGEALIDRIVAGEVSVDSFERSLGTNEMMSVLSKRAARLLGPRGLMPNAKTGTLVAPEDLLTTLETNVAGRDAPFRTEKAGIVHVPVGKGSFGLEKLLENTGAIMKAIYDVKPEAYGKAKKKAKGKAKAPSKNAKYLLSAFVSSTRGPGMKIDLRTVDPSSAFFLTSLDSLSGNGTDDKVPTAASEQATNSITTS